MTESRDVVIVGSGPAGLTAAIYTARADLSPLVLEGEPSSTSDQPGGQLMLTTEVENYPGFVDGVLGPDLMLAFRSQAERFGAEMLPRKATRIDLAQRPFAIYTADEEEPAYRAKALIVATGARSLTLGLPDERRLLGHGVSTCATCDGFFFKGKRVAVVGGGDSALEEALFLTKFADSVTVIHRRAQLRASKIMQDRAMRNDKLGFLWNSTVTRLHGTDRLEYIDIHNSESEEETTMPFDGLFVAIGHAPSTELFRDQLELDDDGYIRTTRGSHTSVPGVFACGDVQDRSYKQAVTAAGSGCMAALDAEHYLETTAHEAAVG
jgi:thioredoxin reductase (NADPH)